VVSIYVLFIYDFTYTPNILNKKLFQIRRQGRNNNGRSISFSKPLTVRDPFEFAVAGRGLQSQSRSSNNLRKFPEMAPVFNLQKMLEEEARKLRVKVEVASLMAAEAVEEAKENVKAIADEAVKEHIVGKVEIDSIVSIYDLNSNHVDAKVAILSDSVFLTR
jgi:hypothetical protein